MSSPTPSAPGDDAPVGAEDAPAGARATGDAPAPDASAGEQSGPAPDQGVGIVHRVGAAVVAVVIGAIGVLGLLGGLGFFDTTGAPVAGLSTNGLLSTISLVTAVVLILAALRGGRLASTIMIVVGVLFIVSAFANLAVIGTTLNLLAFRLPNVFFSIGAGLVLLVLGSYGRVSSKLPDNNPYQLERHGGDAETPESADGHDPFDQPRPATNEEHAADGAMAEAARAIANGTADEEQRRRMEALDEVRTHEDRRRRWMDFDRRAAGSDA